MELYGHPSWRAPVGQNDAVEHYYRLFNSELTHGELPACRSDPSGLHENFSERGRARPSGVVRVSALHHPTTPAHPSRSWRTPAGRVSWTTELGRSVHELRASTPCWTRPSMTSRSPPRAPCARPETAPAHGEAARRPVQGRSSARHRHAGQSWLIRHSHTASLLPQQAESQSKQAGTTVAVVLDLIIHDLDLGLGSTRADAAVPAHSTSLANTQ